jgi:hypothetical protein
MKLTNKSARLVTLNLAGQYVQLVPLATVELTEAQAADAEPLLGGVLKPLIDAGELMLERPSSSMPSTSSSGDTSASNPVANSSAPSASSDTSVSNPVVSRSSRSR